MKTTRTKAAIIAVLLILSHVSHVFAADILVPSEYSTIQSAIEQAIDGDVITVDVGTYNENIDFLGKNITVTSTASGDPLVVAATIIQGDGTVSVVTFANSETFSAVLTGFTITGGVSGTLNDTLGQDVNWGAGIYCFQASPTITDNLLTGNNSATSVYGGAIGCIESNALIERNIFTSNSTFAGGGILVYAGNPTIWNNLFYNNTADYGGGICLLGGGYAINNTMANNTANEGGAHAHLSGVCTASNNIMANAPGGSGVLIESNDVTFTNNDLWSNSPGNYVSADKTGIDGNISQDPLFVDAATNDFHLLPGSPCIDAGNDTPSGGLPAEDFDRIIRPIDGDYNGEALVDIGAYESEGPTVPIISASANLVSFFGIENGGNPAAQILSIRNSGIDTLNWTIQEDCPWLDIAPGAGSSTGEDNYVDISVDITAMLPGEHNCTFEISSPEAINSPKTIEINLRIFAEGELIVPDMYSTIQQAIDNAVDGDSVIVMPGTYYEEINLSGKNILITSFNPDDPAVVSTTTISGIGTGATVTFSGSESPECLLTGFTITGGFGGIAGNQTNANISRCVITENIKDGNGGGIHKVDGDIYACKIINNDGGTGGGLAGCHGTISNCIIAENSGYVSGINNCDGDIINCTIVNNTTNPDGYGVISGCDGIIVNCIIWENSNNSLDNCTAQISYCCTPFGYGDFAIATYPQLTQDYHLTSNSPCINAGDPDLVIAPGTVDIDGQDRVLSWRIDIGADEFDEYVKPVAVAGDYQHIQSVQLVELDGSESFSYDPCGITEFKWTQISGLTVELSDITAMQPTFMPVSEGEYIFELVVSVDGVNWSLPDEVRIVVGNPHSPVADAGGDKLVQIGQLVYLDGSGSYDLDVVDQLSYSWVQAEGPEVTLQNPGTATPYFDCVEAGIYTFTLVVSDGLDDSEADTVELVTIELTVNQQDLDVGYATSDYFHYPDVSGDKVVYGVGSACDVTWSPKYENLTTSVVSGFSGNLIQPKIDGDIVVWMKYGNGWGNPWYHEPSNCSVFARNISTGAQKTLRNWTWSKSYGYPVVSGDKVIWMEHLGLDPTPTGSGEANNWWNTPFNVCGADISNWNSPVYFTVAENAGNHDPYPCHNYGSDFDDVIDISGDIVVWEGNGNIYGADISNLNDIQVFIICYAEGKQFDPAISGNMVVWTDERNDGGDIYGANISDRENIAVFEIVKRSGTQAQPAIDDNMIVYVDSGEIKVCCPLARQSGAVDISLSGSPYGCGPAIDGKTIVWQTASYGEVKGISLEVSYSIANGPIENQTTMKKYDYIQYALDEAEDGEQIVVEPGIYRESLDLQGKNLILTSSDPDDASIVGTTVIIGNKTEPVITFAGTETQDCFITGFTITGGNGGIAGNGTYANISKCVITENIKDGPGGGIHKVNGDIDACKIINNEGISGGGLSGCHGAVSNCIIAENSGYVSGINNCDGNIVNCTITANILKDGGTGVLGGCDGSVTNCIIKGNSSDVLYDCTANINYSCMEGGVDNGNIDVDPLFVLSEDYHLLPASLCIDAGIDTPSGGLSANDIEGNIRSIDGNGDSSAVPDMGAYEYDDQNPCIVVSPKELEFYISEITPVPEAQDLAILNCGGSILNWQIDEDCDWLSVDPAAGQSAGESQSALVSIQPQSFTKGTYRYTVIIRSDNAVNGDQICHVVLHVNNNTLNVPGEYGSIQHAIDASIGNNIVLVAPGVYQENIDFRGKDITVTSTDPDTLSIVDSTVIQGSGLKPVVTFEGIESLDCLLTGFTITGGFGGIAGNGTYANISKCVITENIKDGAGGGIHKVDGDIDACKIINNEGVSGGGLSGCHGTVSNCIIAGNSGYVSGINNCDGNIVNCTITANILKDGGTGVLGGCDGSITNCIIKGNSSDVLYDCSASISYTCMEGGIGDGNIDTAPLFVDAGQSDFHLKSEGWRWDQVNGGWAYDDITSRCVDAGNPGFAIADEALEVSADPLGRFGENIRINMGVYGGTSEASMPPYRWTLLCDLNNNGIVAMDDFAILANQWLSSEQNLSGDVNRNGTVEAIDLTNTASQWLETVDWY